MAITLSQDLIDLAHTKYMPLWNEDWQQAKSLLLPWVTEIAGCEGPYVRFPRIGGTDVKEYSSNSADIVKSSLKHGTYGFKKRKFYNAIDLNDDDTAEAYDLMFNLDTIRKQQRKAAERFMDEVILGVVKDSSTGKYRLKTSADGGYLGGILNTGYAGDDGSTTSSLDLTYAGFTAGTGNLVPVDYASTGTGVSTLMKGTVVDRMQYAVRKLAENEAYNAVDPSELVFLISPAVAQAIRMLEVSVNHDYEIGDIGEFGRPVFNKAIGATIVQTNMLPTMDTEDKEGEDVEGCRMCVAFLKSQVGFGRWRDTEFRIKEESKKVAVDYFLRVRGAFGAGRVRNDAVYVVPILES